VRVIAPRALVSFTLAALALLALAGPAGARELFSHGETRLAISGSVRELAQFGAQTDAGAFEDAILQDLASFNTRCLEAAGFADCPAFDTIGDEDAFQSLTRLRTRLDLQVVEGLRAVVVYDHQLLLGELDTFGSNLGSGFQRDDLFDGDWAIVDDSRAEWRHLFYRGFLQLEAGGLDAIVGRQRIAWGVGRLWNPIDRFNAIPPLAVQGDQSQGIDAIDAKWSFDGFNFVEAVYAPGSSRGDSRVALRFHGVVLDSDISLVGGIFEKARTVGIDFARNLGDAAIRIEAVYTDPRQRVWKIENADDGGPRRLGDFFQVVTSVDYTFDVFGGIYVLVEHLYNGNDLGFGEGSAGSLLPLFEATDVRPAEVEASVPGPYATAGSTKLFGSSRVVTNAENQTGTIMGGDITPELRLDVVSIYDWDGESAAFFPSLRYSPLGSLEVTVGVQTFVGPHRSQYGALETFVYLLADFYF
jgi:hypothetical protein